MSDCLVARVHELVPKDVWSRRYDSIRDLEQMLAEEGTTIVKFFLAIDRDEQRERFQSRLEDPTKRWTFGAGDLDERTLSDTYQVAFEDVLEKSSTESAPWYAIPANRKWFRNLAVVDILVHVIEDLKPEYAVVEGLPAAGAIS